MNPNQSERITKVKNFTEACLRSGFSEIAPLVFERSGISSKVLTLFTLVHGNEIGGMEVFQKIIEEIQTGKLHPHSTLRLGLVNVEAYYEDQRFLETDLNRSFGLSDPRTREELRARELESVLKTTDVLIDVHQTIGPTTTPFYIFEFHQSSYDLARYLHPTLPLVTNTMNRPFKGTTSTGFLIKHGGVGVTIETGQKGIEDTQISLGLEITRKAIETDFTNPIPESEITHTYLFSQIIHNPDKTLEMVRRFTNFEPVRKGELLARNSEIEVHAELDGVILFAKYGDYAKASNELALILKPATSEDISGT